MYRRLEHGPRARAYGQDNRGASRTPTRKHPAIYGLGLFIGVHPLRTEWVKIYTYPLLLIQEWLAIRLDIHHIGPGLIFQSRWLSIKTVAGFPLRYSCRKREALDGRNRQHVERGIRIWKIIKCKTDNIPILCINIGRTGLKLDDVSHFLTNDAGDSEWCTCIKTEKWIIRWRERPQSSMLKQGEQ